ncbi:MAG: hypothetical protein CEE38_08205 [Planctomycetes bacterium B3_Pla]|nr:MAG: hypothetical protein CEE38_08205 [Planctomycetes bacterium B3_Pla]
MKKENVYKEIADVCQNRQDAFLDKQNVVGVATGHKIIEKEDKDTGKPCITLFVTHKVGRDELSSEDMIEETTEEGIETDVVESGEIFAGGNADVAVQEEIGIETLRQRIRPAMGGFSVGHPKVTAGTIATCVYDLRPFPGIPRRYYILSNNHVLANSNNAQIGDPILQPGRYDGGTIPGDIIARLSRFVPIRFKTPTSVPLNYVDAAIAEGQFHNLNREIFWIGYIKQVNSRPTVGTIVEKTGRTTNFTTGRITALNATIDVNYGGGRVARFARQIVTTNMSAGGDSGSLVCDTKEGAVALLFAGSSRVTIASPITYVQSFLGIRLHP